MEEASALKKKIYFVSDLHLGLPSHSKSLEREKLFVRWMDEIKDDVGELYLLGDIFDFWYEYKKVVPRGFTRFLGKLCEFSDRGIPIYFFTGNHDIWAFDYLPEEVGLEIFREPIIKEILGKKFYIGHGDGLGPGDKSYKILKRIFTSKFLQWFFSRIHPNFSLWLAHRWSHHSRYSKSETSEYRGDEKEWLTIFSKELIKKEKLDYIIFGHRHLPHMIEISAETTLLNTGDWISHFSYVVFDGENISLKYFNKKES